MTYLIFESSKGRKDLDKHDGKSSIPIYHNYAQISQHCSRNVLSMVAIDASNYILQTLPFNK